MEKIVIVSEIFAPQNRIAAIRLTKIAKYISRNCDSEITVITRDKDFTIIDGILLEDAKCVDKYIKISEGKILSKINNLREKRIQQRKDNASRDACLGNKPTNIKSRGIKRIIEWVMDQLRFLLDLLNNWSYYRSAKKKLSKVNFDYDVILSSYGPYSSHFIGRYLKKKKPASLWIADFRDPVLNDTTTFGFRRYMKLFAGRICKKADVITAVSRGVMENLFLNEDKKKVVITNGYDREDLAKITTLTKSQNSNKLTFVYTGQLYEGKRDLRPVFRAIRELIEEKYINKNMIRIIYAGQSRREFLSQIAQLGLVDCIEAHDLVRREKALELQINSDVLLLASWNTKREKGVLTGKFFEYMMMNKPIICSISGDASGSDIKKVIEEANMGICYEEANRVDDFLELKRYILWIYNEFMNKAKISFQPNLKCISKYDYNNIAKQFISLFPN